MNNHLNYRSRLSEKLSDQKIAQPQLTKTHTKLLAGIEENELSLLTDLILKNNLISDSKIQAKALEQLIIAYNHQDKFGYFVVLLQDRPDLRKLLEKNVSHHFWNNIINGTGAKVYPTYGIKGPHIDKYAPGTIITENNVPINCLILQSKTPFVMAYWKLKGELQQKKFSLCTLKTQLNSDFAALNDFLNRPKSGKESADIPPTLIHKLLALCQFTVKESRIKNKTNRILYKHKVDSRLQQCFVDAKLNINLLPQSSVLEQIFGDFCAFQAFEYIEAISLLKKARSYLKENFIKIIENKDSFIQFRQYLDSSVSHIDYQALIEMIHKLCALYKEKLFIQNKPDPEQKSNCRVTQEFENELKNTKKNINLLINIYQKIYHQWVVIGCTSWRNFYCAELMTRITDKKKSASREPIPLIQATLCQIILIGEPMKDKYWGVGHILLLKMLRLLVELMTHLGPHNRPATADQFQKSFDQIYSKKIAIICKLSLYAINLANIAKILLPYCQNIIQNALIGNQHRILNYSAECKLDHLQEFFMTTAEIHSFEKHLNSSERSKIIKKWISFFKIKALVTKISATIDAEESIPCRNKRV